jgi:hypothetical protein
VQVRVAEAAVDLNRQRIAAPLVGLERGEQRVARTRWDNVEVEPAAIGRDCLERDETSLPRPRDLLCGRRRAQLLHDPLDSHDRLRVTPGEFAKLVPARAAARRRIAVVDEQPVRPGGAQERGGVLDGVGRKSSLVDGLLRRFAREMLRQ